MKTTNELTSTTASRLMDWCHQAPDDRSCWSTVRDDLELFVDEASTNGLFRLSTIVHALRDLMDLATEQAQSEPESLNAEHAGTDSNDLIRDIPLFVQEAISTLLKANAEVPESDCESDDLQLIADVIEERWSEAISLYRGISPEDDSTHSFETWNDRLPDDSNDLSLTDNSNHADVETTQPVDADAGQQIELLLAILDQHDQLKATVSDDPFDSEHGECPAATAMDSQHAEELGDSAVAAEDRVGNNSHSNRKPPQPPTQLNVPGELKSDMELREAYLDDSQQCLAKMEQIILNGEQCCSQEGLQSFCRELHTLKGASATVGLSDLSTYLHELEEWLEYHSTPGKPLDSVQVNEDALLQAIDSVRKQVALVQTSHSEDSSETQSETITNELSPIVQPTTQNAKRTQELSELPCVEIAVSGGEKSGTTRESSVRVRAAQLNKLMDMLAELVVIRNRRETRVSDVQLQIAELTRCASRLRKFNDQQVHNTRLRAQARDDAAINLGSEPTTSTAIAEIANDLAEVSRTLESALEPISDENTALSLFIRQFRQELVQLNRLPISGLFQRLNRAARDAARTEQKQIQIHLEGEGTAVEQMIQEKLFDPLLHMVRNCVSHGIESVDQRRRMKKSEQGNITLGASATSSMLVLTISDDGRGLDFDAIRRRGYERGLLPLDSIPTTKQLAKLIFHPGFSTRDQASAVSGRGIGMDVVASTLDHLQGRIEVNSEPGRGTTMRVSVPLTTGIEHAMVFRVGKQRFALPMRSVVSACNDRQDSIHNSVAIPLTRLLDCDSNVDRKTAKTLMIDDQHGFFVDEILGPEEVVVRPLPTLLHKHPWVTGAILASCGATVLMLSPDRIRDFCTSSSINDWPFDGDSPTGVRPPTSRGPLDRFIEGEHSCSDGVANRAAATFVDALVVDDSLSARKALTRRLARLGFSVVEVNDGAMAIDQLNKTRFRFVFTDLDMPVMDGFQLLAEIKSRRLSDAKTIVVSSRNPDHFQSQCSHLNVHAFLTKPTSDESLVKLLNQFEPLENR